MNRHLTTIVLLVAALASPAVAETTDEDLANEDRMRSLERKVELLTDELARTRQDMAVPEDDALESQWGMGPGASKIYGISKGLSIGGYAEGHYGAVVKDKRESGEVNEADFYRVVLYTGYKFTDNLIFNSEIEFEHGSTEKNGAVSVEFATLDYLFQDEVNARAGMVLVPMGFVNQIHEPPFYYGNNRPDVERTLIPSTWREVGGGLFGEIGEIIDYKAYVIASLDAAEFTASGIRGGRQQGSESRAEDMAFVGRVDVTPIPQLLLGGSLFVGNTGQDRDYDVNGDGIEDVSLPDARLTLWEAHAEFTSHGLRARALYTMGHLADAGDLTRALGPTALGGTGALDGNDNGLIDTGEVIASKTRGYYGEIGYEILQWLLPQSSWTVEPFVRAEWIDTQFDVPSGFDEDRSKKFRVITTGISAKPIPNVVFKIDYRDRNPRTGELGDEVNAGLGLVF